MTDNERTARIEEALKALAHSVDGLRDAQHEAIMELRTVSGRVARLEFAAERTEWWFGQAARYGIPVLLGLVGLGLMSWVLMVVGK